MDKLQCMRCHISGRVQKVWFRASAKEQAGKLGITGWAKNLQDGGVEILACGTVETLEQFYRWLQHGPPLARVTGCTREDWSFEHHHDGFKTV